MSENGKSGSRDMATHLRNRDLPPKPGLLVGVRGDCT